MNWRMLVHICSFRGASLRISKLWYFVPGVFCVICVDYVTVTFLLHARTNSCLQTLGFAVQLMASRVSKLTSSRILINC